MVPERERDPLVVEHSQPDLPYWRREEIEGGRVANDDPIRAKPGRFGYAVSDSAAAGPRALARRELVDRVRHEVDQVHAVGLESREPWPLRITRATWSLTVEGLDDAAKQVVA